MAGKGTGGAEEGIATFGGGCFWCTEAVFQGLKGVRRAVPGYMGGQTGNPTYEEVCTGATGHAEVVRIAYEPSVVSFGVLLEVFWATHDPTSPGRQGNDVGTQYRSAVFYHGEKQKALAEAGKAVLEASGAWPGPVVTEVSPATAFYPAEAGHRDYFNLHGSAPYCEAVIRPKVEGFRKAFADRLKG